MRYTKHFVKTRRNVSQEIESVNGQLLTRGGFIYQEIAGVYTFLPLGLRVLNKIEAIIRKHMDKIATEILLTALHPLDKWSKTGRLDEVDVLFKASGANELSKKLNSTEYVLAPTHEETLTPLVGQFVQSYRDLPVALYQIQTKFRNEARAKSGLLRGREFRMKDLYSFHADEEDLKKYYETAKEKYRDVFDELGIGADTYLTYASGGTFTTEFSHEYQVEVETGEDTIFIDRESKIAYNKEIANQETEKKLGVSFKKMDKSKGCEVGNIFPLNTKFSDIFGFTYLDKNGDQKPVFMGCYGIGSSRNMGVIVEKCHDDKGIIWPKNVAPFTYHLITITSSSADPAFKKSKEFYSAFPDDVLWDDRLGVGAGDKFADADLIGCPVRVVVSENSMKKGGFEIKLRQSDEIRFAQNPKDAERACQ